MLLVGSQFLIKYWNCEKTTHKKEDLITKLNIYNAIQPMLQTAHSG